MTQIWQLSKWKRKWGNRCRTDFRRFDPAQCSGFGICGPRWGCVCARSWQVLKLVFPRWHIARFVPYTCQCHHVHHRHHHCHHVHHQTDHHNRHGDEDDCHLSTQSWQSAWGLTATRAASMSSRHWQFWSSGLLMKMTMTFQNHNDQLCCVKWLIRWVVAPWPVWGQQHVLQRLLRATSKMKKE